MIRVVLPAHLRALAQVDGEVQVAVHGPVTQASVLDALEARYPVLRGAIRDHGTLKRRAYRTVLDRVFLGKRLSARAICRRTPACGPCSRR